MTDWNRALASVIDEIGSWLEAMRVALGAENGQLWVTEAATTRLALFMITPDGGGRALPQEVPLAGHALGWVVSEGVTLRATRSDVFQLRDQGWVVAVPIADRESVRRSCVVMEFNHAPGAHASRALELAAEMASRLIDGARSGLAARSDLDKNEALFGAVHDLDRGLDLVGLARGVSARARNVAGARSALFALWDAAAGRGEIIALDGELDERLLHAPLDRSSSFMGLALANGTPLPRDHLSGRESLALYVKGVASRAGSAIIAPLIVDPGSEPIAGLAVDYDRPRGFDDGDVKRLIALARFVAPSVRNAAEYGMVREMSLTDALTGLPNRRATERSLASAMAVAERSKGAFAVAVLDVDHFKSFNDRYGHDAGDVVLESVARVVRDSLRPGDVAGRWGGEEFLVVLPSTGLDDATQVVERIRRSVEAGAVSWDGRPLKVTLSAGVSAYPEVVKNTGGVVSSADAALYRAKRGGRNAVAVAEMAGRK